MAKSATIDPERRQRQVLRLDGMIKHINSLRCAATSIKADPSGRDQLFSKTPASTGHVNHNSCSSPGKPAELAGLCRFCNETETGAASGCQSARIRLRSPRYELARVRARIALWPAGGGAVTASIPLRIKAIRRQHGYTRKLPHAW